MITRQHSRERPREIEQEEEEDEEKGSEVEKTRQDNRGRSRQQSPQSTQVDLKPPIFRAGRTGASTLTGCAPSQPGLGPITPPRQKIRPKPSESPLRTRLLSPFRILRDRSQSNERAKPVQADGETTPEAPPSPKQDDREEKRARRSVSPNPFLWLCRVRHVRRKTL